MTLVLEDLLIHETKVVTVLVLKWTGKIFTSLLLLLIAMMLIVTVSAKINGGAPKLFGRELLTVLSGSMEPGIKTGSIILVRPVTPQNEHFQKGDVITFQSPDNSSMMITHRIVDIKGSGNNLLFTTKGDNNDSQDPSPVPVGNVVAQYENFTIPYLGYVLSWVKTKWGIGILLVLPGLYLIVQSLITLYRAIASGEEAEPAKAESAATAEAQTEATSSNEATPTEATPT